MAQWVEPILCFSLKWVEPILFVANQAPANGWFWASLRRSQSKQCLFCKRRVIGAWNCKQPAENYYTRTCTGQLEIGLKDKM